MLVQCPGTRLCAFSAALLAVATPTPSGGQGQDGPQAPSPTLEDLFTVKGLGGIDVSPDGAAALYTVANADLEQNETNTDIWLLRRDGSGWAEPIQLTHSRRNDTSPQWRGGRTFAFLSSRADDDGDRDAQQNLFLMDAGGGEPRLLYDHATSIAAFDWSPDGRFIAFRAADEESEDEEDRKKRGRDTEVEDEAGRFSHVWLLDVEAEEARRVTAGREYTVGGFAWSPDGQQLAFSATPTDRPGDSWRSDLYVVAAHDTSAAPRKLTHNPGPDANPIWSPDGRHLVYRGQQTGRYQIAMNRAYRMSVDGGAPELIAPHADMQAGSYTLTPDGRGAFFQATTGTTRGLFYVPLDGRREPVRLTPAVGVFQGAGYSADRRTLVYVFQSPESPAELYAASVGDWPAQASVRATTPLTSHNAHASSWAVGRTEVLDWNGADGRAIEGLVVYPANWSQDQGARALVVKIHGGPSGVFVQNFQAASTSADAQRYAADGYVVLLPNPRGSSGYGEDGLQAVVGDWGGLDFRDIMAGVDTLIARGVAHPDSLGVMGWSYGGYMTAWTVTQTTRFRAAVAGAAITEHIAMWGTQDIQHVFEAYFGGGPYEPGMWEVYQRSNPLAFVSRATTPTLIIHGENDPRVPPNQARIFYRGLEANGVPTKLLWLPRTGHGPREPGLRFETANHQKAWMDQWIRGRTPTPVSDEDSRGTGSDRPVR